MGLHLQFAGGLLGLMRGILRLMESNPDTNPGTEHITHELQKHIGELEAAEKKLPPVG